jgi:hypothetical protein
MVWCLIEHRDNFTVLPVSLRTKLEKVQCIKKNHLVLTPTLSEKGQFRLGRSQELIKYRRLVRGDKEKSAYWDSSFGCQCIL